MNNSNETASTSSAEIEAARILLSRLGITAEQLLDPLACNAAKTVPTFAEYIPQVEQAVTAGTRRVYGSYWKRIRAEWGSRRLDEPTALEIQQLAERAREGVIIRRNSRGGRNAVEHLISAIRCVYRFAEAEGLVQESKNPARRASKPRRLTNTRRALLDHQLTEVVHTASSTGNDPELDTLLIRLHVETACRRGGALALRPCDIDREQCLIRLREKGETERWQPVSPTLMRNLLWHVEERGDGNPHSQLLRYRSRKPITRRRYDNIWERLGAHLPWVATQQISTHWLRHTTLTWVERHFGYAIARAYAGHNERHDHIGTTATYVRADLYEVVAALMALTGEPHPLANGSQAPAYATAQ